MLDVDKVLAMQSRSKQSTLSRIPTLALFAFALVASAYGLAGSWHIHLEDGADLFHNHRHLTGHAHASFTDDANGEPVQAPEEVPGQPGSVYLSIATGAITEASEELPADALAVIASAPTLDDNALVAPELFGPRTSRGPPA